jgi:hypothetical protein
MIKRVKGAGKIKNVTARKNPKLFYDNIWFKSMLEVYMYQQLEKLGEKFTYEAKKYQIVEGFEYLDEKIRPIHYTPDFEMVDYPVIVETKGFATDSFGLRMKLFKRYVKNESIMKRSKLKWIFVPHNQKECREVIEQIKEKFNL